MAFTEREQVVEVLNRLFYHTDQREWAVLQEEVFAPKVMFDMTSLGASKAEEMTSEQICEAWNKGFEGLDSVHHQAGNYMISIDGTKATVKAYAMATHYKAEGTPSLKEFVGSYDFRLAKTEAGWRLTAFAFHLKYMCER